MFAFLLIGEAKIGTKNYPPKPQQTDSGEFGDIRINSDFFGSLAFKRCRTVALTASENKKREKKVYEVQFSLLIFGKTKIKTYLCARK